MITAGIICEYNPLHLGHLWHIEQTKRALGHDCAVVCVMSGNFVQRGDFAVFSKHARAQAAVSCGADLVVELPSPYALSSAEIFARSGVYLLHELGICSHISFGSESGDIGELKQAAQAMLSFEADAMTKKWLDTGISYAKACQKAADAMLGPQSKLFETPNNLLGIEYLKAIEQIGAALTPVTVKRAGDAHDSPEGQSGSALRKMLYNAEPPWKYMPPQAAHVYMNEIELGRGPVSMKDCELAILSRLRAATLDDFLQLPGTSEGLEQRFIKHARTAPGVAQVLEGVKTKRYAMSRLRRMLMCLCLGITAADTALPPPYIRVLAINGAGMRLLKEAGMKTRLPIITKPASAQKLPEPARSLFYKEAAATDFYALAYRDETQRIGGAEWLTSPYIMRD